MNELHLFAGAGGGILAGRMLGHRCVCAVENSPYAQAILVSRQNDGSIPAFPIWDDVTTFDGTPWRGVVDLVAGGFPCQDISQSGLKAGIEGERSGLWAEMARIIREVNPRVVFVENVSALLHRGMGTVLSDLAEMGLDAQWGVLGAADLGANHKRERVWILANSKGFRWQPALKQPGILQAQRENRTRPSSDGSAQDGANLEWPIWPTESGLVRVADGVADRIHRIKAIGNGQVPRVAAAAFSVLSGRL